MPLKSKSNMAGQSFCAYVTVTTPFPVRTPFSKVVPDGPKALPPPPPPNHAPPPPPPYYPPPPPPPPPS
jgi:hypothetical protein